MFSNNIYLYLFFVYCDWPLWISKSDCTLGCDKISAALSPVHGQGKPKRWNMNRLVSILVTYIQIPTKIKLNIHNLDWTWMKLMYQRPKLEQKYIYIYIWVKSSPYITFSLSGLYNRPKCFHIGPICSNN